MNSSCVRSFSQGFSHATVVVHRTVRESCNIRGVTFTLFHSLVFFWFVIVDNYVTKIIPLGSFPHVFTQSKATKPHWSTRADGHCVGSTTPHVDLRERDVCSPYVSDVSSCQLFVLGSQPNSVDLSDIAESPYTLKQRPHPVGRGSDGDEGKENFLVPETPRCVCVCVCVCVRV